MGSEILRLPVQPEDRLAPTIELPAPTAWPIVLAFGLTLVFAGLVTSVSVSLPGAILTVAGCVGWFREVLPHEKHESVQVVEKGPAVATSRPQVTRVAWMTQELHRARLPLEIYPISAGIKGGLAGSVAMAVLAVIYGIVSGHGMWYPINLLSAGFFPARTSIEQIAAFHWDALIIATIIHLLCSVLVAFFTASRFRCFRAIRFCLEARSRLYYGLACCTAFSKPLIPCSTSASIGSGL